MQHPHPTDAASAKRSTTDSIHRESRPEILQSDWVSKDFVDARKNDQLHF